MQRRRQREIQRRRMFDVLLWLMDEHSMLSLNMIACLQRRTEELRPPNRPYKTYLLCTLLGICTCSHLMLLIFGRHGWNNNNNSNKSVVIPPSGHG